MVLSKYFEEDDCIWSWVTVIPFIDWLWKLFTIPLHFIVGDWHNDVILKNFMAHSYKLNKENKNKTYVKLTLITWSVFDTSTILLLNEIPVKNILLADVWQLMLTFAGTVKFGIETLFKNKPKLILNCFVEVSPTDQV